MQLYKPLFKFINVVKHFSYAVCMYIGPDVIFSVMIKQKKPAHYG